MSVFVKPLDESSILRLAEEISPAACGLRLWLRAERESPWVLNERGREQVAQLVEAGLTLRASWPRSWSAVIERQLGKRLYLSFAGNFSPTLHCTSIVCSALGRDGQKLPQWPMLLDLALQHMARQGSQLLLVPHTTTYAWAQEFARRAELPCLELEIARASSMAQWLSESLQRLLAEHDPQPLRQRVLVSPGNAATDLPLQDQFSIVLSDSIVALAVRPAGKLERLLQMRLAESEFPLGTVFVALPAQGSDAAHRSRRGCSARDAWLPRGAVGWYVLSPSPRPAAEWLSCRPLRPPPVQQLTASLERMFSHEPGTEAVEWLAHCTRGNAGPWPDESDLSFRRRAWLAGVQAQPHPLLTLMRICREGNLTGTSRITRTEERCVSFSAVPVRELLKRRTFRSHLSRWDWEPYGLLVRRDAMEQLGARPVCYGSEADYEALPANMRPYFQPASRVKRGAAPSPDLSWSEEREWRLLGDLALDHLPAGGLLVFVRTRREAEQLSRCVPCPVLWNE